MAATSSLDEQIAALAKKYLPVAVSILREAIRIPADHVTSDDPRCGLSNHERPRLEVLKRSIIEHRAVDRPEDVYFDDFGNIVWTAQDPTDGIPPEKKKVVYFDGHTDTVNALRDQWASRVGPGLDSYNGLVDPAQVNETALKRELGFVPPRDEWDHLVWGRGAADQLAGVISQILATKIMLELRPLGALRGVIIRSYGTVAEEDNDGGAPMYVCSKVLPHASPDLIPDAVIYTEGTGDSRLPLGSLGIYRGQRGRMQIEVDVIGKSCHGSMPWEGRNPLEAGSLIIAEAAAKYQKREGFKDDAFLCHGTRTASWAVLQTPSDCAVPERFTFRFDRRLTVGESAEQALLDVETLDSVKDARAKGFTVDVRVPLYTDATWKGFRLNNKQIYNAWITPEEHPAIQAAVAAYKAVVTPHIVEGKVSLIPATPRVSRWIFSTDGVGFIVPSPTTSVGIDVPATKLWVDDGKTSHPAMFGIGAGFEQNTHKIGECVDSRELQHAIAFLSRFPSMLAASH
ncbi:M20/M25/M40 family metallo-hydrolase [Pelomyxa schiedti]|nr:M20/M25/M40 family metallo-hydrolase [Pelomyxa schiedti]